jgi:hypothetical protein
MKGGMVRVFVYLYGVWPVGQLSIHPDTNRSKSLVKDARGQNRGLLRAALVLGR